MRLHDVHREVHANRKRKRIGRGPGSGRGKTSGRGHKGAGSRAGFSMRPTFEGGQMPLARRIPKRGFHNQFAPRVVTINIGQLQQRFSDGDEVTPDALAEKNLAKGPYDVLKILGDGELTKRLRVVAHRFSRSAEEKIRQAGGEAVVLPGKAPVVKNKMKAKREPQ